MCLQPGFLQRPGRISPNQPIQRARQQCRWHSSAHFPCLSPPLFTRAGLGVGTSVPSSLSTSCPKMPHVPPGHHLSPLVTTFPSLSPIFLPGCHLPLLPIPTATGGDEESTPLTHLVPFPDPNPRLVPTEVHNPTPHRVMSQKNPFGHQPHPGGPHTSSPSLIPQARDARGRGRARCGVPQNPSTYPSKRTVPVCCVCTR